MKKAFTMAEILISLAIMGVVAALTLPNLSVNVQKSQCGPALMKAINDMDQANRWILNDRDSKSIKVACDIENNAFAGREYLSCLIPPLKLEKVAVAKDVEYADKKGNKRGADFTLKTGRRDVYGFAGVNIWASEESSYQETAVSDGVTTEILPIYMDINGIEKGPNTLGKDLFELFLDIKNNVIYGTSVINDIGTTNGEEKKMAKCEVSGEHCAYFIMKNNGKVTYKW